jgi:hypothetical protein
MTLLPHDPPPYIAQTLIHLEDDPASEPEEG